MSFNHLVTRCRKLFFGFTLLLAVQEASAFTMLYHVSNPGAPDFKAYGFETSYIVYEQYLYDSEDSRFEAITDRKIERQARKIRRALPSGAYVQIDIEGWHPTHGMEPAWIRERYRSTMARIKARLPEYKVGYYRIVPVWAHWDMHKSTGHHKEWVLENRLREPISEEVDVLYPALYTYHGDPELWRKTAIAVLKKARELAKDKPVIPFLWPRFHPSSDVGGEGKILVPENYWFTQLETVLEHADGFVLWNDGRTRIWSDDFPWWKATLRFLQRHFPERLPVNSGEEM